MKRVLLKLSGEALSAGSEGLYNCDFVDRVAKTIAEGVAEGFEIALVIGAGNIWRGRSGGDMDRATADQMGMLATAINALCMKDALLRAGVRASVMTAIAMSPFAEQFNRDLAMDRLAAGEVVIFGAGLGMPFISTDTAGAVRAAEIGADAILMAKNVDHIYSDDPRKNPDAVKLETISCTQMLALGLGAIDATAAAFCKSTGVPIRIFGLRHPEDILKALKGEKVGTIVTAD